MWRRFISSTNVSSQTLPSCALLLRPINQKVHESTSCTFWLVLIRAHRPGNETRSTVVECACIHMYTYMYIQKKNFLGMSSKFIAAPARDMHLQYQRDEYTLDKQCDMHVSVSSRWPCRALQWEGLVQDVMFCTGNTRAHLCQTVEAFSVTEANHPLSDYCAHV